MWHECNTKRTTLFNLKDNQLFFCTKFPKKKINIWKNKKSNKWAFITWVNLNSQNYENRTINCETSDPLNP